MNIFKNQYQEEMAAVFPELSTELQKHLLSLTYVARDTERIARKITEQATKKKYEQQKQLA